jgi:diacylglycerol kinase (ATP)
MVQFSIGILLTIAGFYFGITTTEWLSNNGYRSVMSIEGLNTAVEKKFYSSSDEKIGL